MSVLRSLFEMYGALDEAVMRSNDPRVAHIVEKVLPGASANPGWYRDLEDFFFGERKAGPNPIAAVKAIKSESVDAPLTLAEKSRLFAAAVANDAIASTPSQQGIQPSEGGSVDGSFIEALELLAPPPQETRLGFQPTKAASEAADRTKAVKEIREGLSRDETINWALTRAQEGGIVDPLLPPMTVHLPAVIKVDGLDALVVDTETITPLISLNEMKSIVNPYNWADNYGAFFLSMVPTSRLRNDGWPTVIETVGFGGLEAGGARTLKTALKYYVTGTAPDDIVARLDYDLDDPSPGDGDGIVRIDRGYINMWAWNADHGVDPDVKGVAIRTRKVVRIDGLAPDRQARLLQISGYGLGSTELLIEPALSDSASKDPKCFDYPLGTDSAPTDELGSQYVEPGSHFAPTAVSLLTETARANAEDYLAVADKWMAGQLSYYDLAEFSKNVSGRLARAPWRFIEAMSHPRRIRAGTDEEGGA